VLVIDHGDFKLQAWSMNFNWISWKRRVSMSLCKERVLPDSVWPCACPGF